MNRQDLEVRFKKLRNTTIKSESTGEEFAVRIPSASVAEKKFRPLWKQIDDSEDGVVEGIRAKVLAYALVDEDSGEPLYDWESEADLACLGEALGHGLANELFTAYMKKMNPNPQELAGNSPGTPKNDSGSSSVELSRD